MKNVFFASAFMLIGSFVYPFNGLENEKIKELNVNGVLIKIKKASRKSLTEPKNKDYIFCRVDCAVTVNGVSYRTSAGSFLSSCDRAGRRCREKLQQAIR